MKNTSAGDRITFFLFGAAIGATTALLLAPESGARTRRKIRRKAEDASDYLVEAGKDLVEECEDLYKRSRELVDDAAHELSSKYHDLYEHSKRLTDEALAVLRR